MSNKNNELNKLSPDSKVELIDQALLSNVSGGSYDMCTADLCTTPGGGNMCSIDICSITVPPELQL